MGNPPSFHACSPDQRLPHTADKEFLNPISDQNPPGEFLNQTPLYGHIQDARRQDDPRLSQGIWRTPPKKADRSRVVLLCEDALKTKTKDLQLLAWLIEAWTALEGLQGLKRGFHLLGDFLTHFWSCFYPPADPQNEHRLQILDWLDRNAANQLLSLTITHNPGHKRRLTLGQWIDAVYLDQTRRQSPEKLKNPIDQGVTMDFFMQELSQTPSEQLQVLRAHAQDCSTLIDSLQKQIERLSENQPPSFKNLTERFKYIHTVTEAVTLYKPTPSIPQVPEETTLPPSDQRQALYTSLSQLTTLLEKSDPQGVVPLFLRRLLDWKDLTLFQFLQTHDSQKMAVLIEVFGPTREAAQLPLPAPPALQQGSSPAPRLSFHQNASGLFPPKPVATKPR